MSNSYERKQNTGTLFQNDKQNDRQPDFTGPILIDKSMIPLIERGVELRIAGWHKESASGLKMINVAVSEKQQPKENDDVPF